MGQKYTVASGPAYQEAFEVCRPKKTLTTTAPDPGIFERGGSPLAVCIALLIFSFLMKLYEIIEPHLLEKRGFDSLNPPLDPALYEY